MSRSSKRTPRGLRLHIGLFGRRNVGKSSLLNALTRQSAAIVSDQAGTTTDPVEKPMELLPLGPVLFIDTAGIDDEGALGQQRVKKTRRALKRTDLALIVTDGSWGPFEEGLLAALAELSVPTLVVGNKADQGEPASELLEALAQRGVPYVPTVAPTRQGVPELRDALVKAAPPELLKTPTLLADLVPPGELALLVVPIDAEAPKGRLIAPQVQSIRELLDNDSLCMVVKERELRDALALLRRPPALVVTDSQAFLKVAADCPPEGPLTSFSILFSRLKGDLVEFARGARAIEGLRSGARVLVAEACAHHPINEDIGTVKIPRWLTQFVGGELRFEHAQGRDFPEDLSPYDLVIHCGACVWNRRAMLSRVRDCRTQGVPITNYGMAIATCLGIRERALRLFPEALEPKSSGSDRISSL